VLAGGLGDLSSLPETPAEGKADFRALIGVGAVSRPEYIGSDRDDTTAPIPLINVSYKDIAYFKFNRAGVWFWKAGDTGVRFGALLKPRQGWDDSDDRLLAGMGERDDSIEAGLNMAWRSERAEIEVGVLTDVSDESDGNSAFIDLRYAFVKSPRWQLLGKVGFEYLDDDVTEYYWGVPPSQAVPGRSAYSPDEAWNTSVGLLATYSLSDNWKLMGGAVYTLLGDEIEDSPIVKEDDSVTTVIGVAFKF
jgi:outer membrane protein